MIKRLNLLIAISAAAGVGGIVAVMSRSETREGVAFHGKAIQVYGRDYTLARIAQLAAEAGQSELFTYDASRREAMANASIIIHGSLQVGDPADPSLGETLLLNTFVCGDLQVQVARGGELRIHNSVLQTVSQIITEDKCSRGYYFVADGTLEAADSRILYMSGARGRTVTTSSRVNLRRVAFALADDVAFHALLADGARLDIADSQFLCEGRYGVWVEGLGGEPLRLIRCRLSGSEADIYLSGSRPVAELTDCQFSRTKIRFQQNSGRVVIRWTATVRAVERGTGRPIPSLDIEATSEGSPAETVRTRTGPDGACTIVLTESIATPSYPDGEDPANTFTPHRIVALSPSGKPLAELRGYQARGPGGAIILELPPTP